MMKINYEWCLFLHYVEQGLVHISQLANQRVDEVGDILKTGDKIRVKVVCTWLRFHSLSLMSLSRSFLCQTGKFP